MDIDRELDSTDFYKNKPAKLYRFRNWDPYTKSDCNMNVKYHKTSSPSFDKKQQYEDALYKLEFEPSNDQPSECIKQLQSLQVDASSVTRIHATVYIDMVKDFTFYSTIVMLFLIYNYDDETNKIEVLFHMRYYSPETHG